MCNGNCTFVSHHRYSLNGHETNIFPNWRGEKENDDRFVYIVDCVESIKLQNIQIMCVWLFLAIKIIQNYMPLFLPSSIAVSDSVIMDINYFDRYRAGACTLSTKIIYISFHLMSWRLIDGETVIKENVNAHTDAEMEW